MEKKVYVFKNDETMKRCVSLTTKAEKYRNDHDWEEAFINYNEAISLAPSVPNIYYGRGCTYLLIASIDKLLNQGGKNRL